MIKFFLPLFFFLCGGCNHTPFNEKKAAPIVLVSIPPYADLVEHIAGETVQVEILAPPGTNPHIYEPSPHQINRIAQTQIWFCSGEAFETKILPAIQANNTQMSVYSLIANIQLLYESHHHCCHAQHAQAGDLHVWLDPRILEKQVLFIADKLEKTFPEHGEFYRKNSQQFCHKLKQFYQDSLHKLAVFKGEAILVSHPAFAYFCNAYGFQQISLEQEGKDPLPQDISETIAAAREHHVCVALTQIQYNNKGTLWIAKQLDLPVYSVDPYAQDNLANLQNLVDIIANVQRH